MSAAASWQQVTSTVLMIRPARFGFNEQTAANNAFQSNDPSLSQQEIQQQALVEFDEFVAKLRSAGIEVIVVEDTEEPVKTDAVFPNNWVSFHGNGTVITYPMFSGIRRLERREDVVEELVRKYGFSKRVQLEHFEAEDRFLEGTGSMVLDRQNRIVYACSSPRTHREVLEQFATETGYKPVIFRATDDRGTEIYHTNVMMAVGVDFAIVCLESVEEKSRDSLRKTLHESGKEVIEITLEQMKQFAGNMLQLRNNDGQTFLVMSQQAYNSLDELQINSIEKLTRILHTPLDVIEKYGGGSARCMLAEVFLPK